MSPSPPKVITCPPWKLQVLALGFAEFKNIESIENTYRCAFSACQHVFWPQAPDWWSTIRPVLPLGVLGSGPRRLNRIPIRISHMSHVSPAFVLSDGQRGRAVGMSRRPHCGSWSSHGDCHTFIDPSVRPLRCPSGARQCV